MPQDAKLQYWLKRGLDILCASVFLLCVAPVLVLIAILVFFNLGVPILFRQERAGMDGRSFTVLKFRTMLDAYDPAGALLPDALRLTRFGYFLRRTSLDELPELFNVLRGEMSLVGPRPLLLEYLDRYTPEQARRHEVRPGITGWAQINGRNILSWEQKFQLDVWYVDHRGLLLDLKILALTVWKVCTREGVNEPGQVTAQKFLGSSC